MNLEAFAEVFVRSKTLTVIKVNYTHVARSDRPKTTPRGAVRSGSRTIAKAKVQKTTGGNSRAKIRADLKASARYYSTRPNDLGERQHREGFTNERDAVSMEEIDANLEAGLEGDEARFAYRMVLSPGSVLNDDELREWTRATLHSLDDDGLRGWVAFAHTDQTDHPHVHVIAFTDEYLDQDTWREVREAGDAALEVELAYRRMFESAMDGAEREMAREFERDSGLEHAREAGVDRPESSSSERGSSSQTDATAPSSTGDTGSGGLIVETEAFGEHRREPVENETDVSGSGSKVELDEDLDMDF